MQPRLDGPDRPADALSDGVQSEIGPVVEDDDLPVVLVERGHRPEDLIAVEERPEWIPTRAAGFAIVERDQPNLASAAKAIAADVDEDPVEPGLEPGRIAQGGRSTPGAQQRILGRVLRLVLIAEDQAGQSIGAVKLPIGQPKELVRGVGSAPVCQPILQ